MGLNLETDSSVSRSNRWNFRRGIARGFLAFTRTAISPNKTSPPALSDKIWAGIALTVIFLVASLLVIAIGTAEIESNRFSQLSPAEHLARATADCGEGTSCRDPEDAIHEISAIGSSAPEYETASKLRGIIVQQQTREKDQAQETSRDQMERNFHRQANDPFICSTSTDNKTIVSFDNGQFWWYDDGRCAGRQQKKRDEDAQIDSYWSTRVRVDTDMNSFWLPEEERTCQSFPGSEGRVNMVLCDPTGKADHNIPVVFWGGVDRNTVSDWKCRREKDLLSDEFVCRAIN